MDFLVPGARSLKDKRRAVKSLKERMRSRFNCSVAEIAFADKWGRARIAVCVVSTESRHANSQLDEIVRFAGHNDRAELLDYQIELL